MVQRRRKTEHANLQNVAQLDVNVLGERVDSR
jgi:hypothetical protein